MPGDPARKLATYQDVLDAPGHLVAEIVCGNLSLMPRPRPLHARAASRLGMGLAGFDGLGSGSPGGWLILDEPEPHLGHEIRGSEKERAEPFDAIELDLGTLWAR